MSAMQNFFKMYSELKDEVDSLKADVKALRESNNKKTLAVKKVVENLAKWCHINYVEMPCQVILIMFVYKP